jgi:hypothetical protein
MSDRTVITPEIAHQVLWHYGCADHEARIGYPPGDFIAKLLSAITRADPGNRARLALGFPGYVEACRLIESTGTGVARLRKIADAGRGGAS